MIPSLGFFIFWKSIKDQDEFILANYFAQK